MNHLKQYLDTIAKLEDSLISVDKGKIQDYGLLATYKLVSANLSRFLPSIDRSKHLELIKKVHHNNAYLA